MTYRQLEDFRKTARLTYNQMDKLLYGINIHDIETITYNAETNTFKITISKDAYCL